MRVLIVASFAPSLINFRLPLIQDMIKLGHEVAVSAPFVEARDKECRAILADLGVTIFTTTLRRNSLSFISDAIYLCSLFRCLYDFRPFCVFSYTLKPVIYSGIVIGLLKSFFQIKLDYYPFITGLGSFFTFDKSKNGFSFVRYVLGRLYQISLKSSSCTIFQNLDDINDFKTLGVISEKCIYEVVSGSGVDLNLFPPSPLPPDPIFLMVARLLWNKGVREYVEAARIVKKRYPSASFWLAGWYDYNPSAITPAELDSLISNGEVSYLGSLQDVNSILALSKYYVLPSYREGTPRSVLEALSKSRPILTTDVPGCRNTVIDGWNGFLVKSRDSLDLAKGMMKLLQQDESENERMASASLLLAKTKYDVKLVNSELIRIMSL